MAGSAVVTDNGGSSRGNEPFIGPGASSSGKLSWIVRIYRSANLFGSGFKIHRPRYDIKRFFVTNHIVT